LSNLDSVYRIFTVFLLIVPCVMSLSVNSQNATLINAVSSNNECEEEIRLICRGMGSLRVSFGFTDGVRLPINTSDFATEPSFTSVSVSGQSPYAYGWWKDYANVRVRVDLKTTFISISEGKLKADMLVAEFEKLLKITLLYYGNDTWRDSATYYYKAENPSSALQKLKDAFLEYRPSQGFDKVVTPNLLDDRTSISFSLEKEAEKLMWKTGVEFYIPHYVSEEWFGWLGNEYTISLKELADYSGNITASPYSTKSTLSLWFIIESAFLQIIPKEEVRCLEIVPSQMNVSRDGEVFERDITGGSVEDLYIRFKWVMPWWSLIGATVVTLGVVAFIIGVGITPLKKLSEKIPGSIIGFLFVVGLIFGLMSFLLITLNIIFLFNPSIAFNQYGRMGFGVWLGIWVAIAFVIIFPLAKELKKWRKKRKEPKAWELEDQLKELKEQLGRGVITREEYEQEKKKLLGKSEAKKEANKRT